MGSKAVHSRHLDPLLVPNRSGKALGGFGPLQSETGIQNIPMDVVSGRPVAASTTLLRLPGPKDWISLSLGRSMFSL